ncbi:MAG: adenylate kinase family enzyme [Patescibacteria group bacterium]|jgi:adenylate kinase family enzyme
MAIDITHNQRSLDERIGLIPIFGRPGCGKGTVIEKLMNEDTGYNSDHMVIEMSALLKESLGTKQFNAMSGKGLVTNDVTIPLFRDYLYGISGDSDVDILDVYLDGFPRNGPQAEAFYESFASSIDRAIYLELQPEMAIERAISRGKLAGDSARHDDLDIDIIRGRQETYDSETVPGIDYLSGKLDGRFYSIDANSNPETVYANVLSALLD